MSAESRASDDTDTLSGMLSDLTRLRQVVRQTAHAFGADDKSVDIIAEHPELLVVAAEKRTEQWREAVRQAETMRAKIAGAVQDGP